MNNQNESISNLDSITQHFDKRNAIKKLLKQHEIPSLPF
jgi:hypothetical protein